MHVRNNQPDRAKADADWFAFGLPTPAHLSSDKQVGGSYVMVSPRVAVERRRAEKGD